MLHADCVDIAEKQSYVETQRIEKRQEELAIHNDCQHLIVEVDTHYHGSSNNAVILWVSSSSCEGAIHSDLVVNEETSITYILFNIRNHSLTRLGHSTDLDAMICYQLTDFCVHSAWAVSLSTYNWGRCNIIFWLFTPVAITKLITIRMSLLAFYGSMINHGKHNFWGKFNIHYHQRTRRGRTHSTRFVHRA